MECTQYLLKNIYLQDSGSEDNINMALRAGCEVGQLIEMPLIHDHTLLW
jgi:hypothetical protein